jgi:antirestriction protein ArdC
MGASFLSAHVGNVEATVENSAAYLAGWLKALNDDKKLIVHAAAQAQKAGDFILSRAN